MTRHWRILSITVGLMAAGAFFGGLAGGLALLVAVSISEGAKAGFDTATDLWLLQFPVFVGAVLGSVGLPGIAWLLLRRVPLGQAILGSVLGAVVGGTLGWTLGSGFAQVNQAILGAFAGFLIAALVMRQRARPIDGTRDHAA